MVNPLVSHEDGGQAEGAVNVEQLYTRARAHGSESKERRQIEDRKWKREREREREEAEAPVSPASLDPTGPRALLRLYACEPRRRDIAPRDTRGARGGATVSGPSGIIDVSHREQRAACSSLWRNKSLRSVIDSELFYFSNELSNVPTGFLRLLPCVVQPRRRPRREFRKIDEEEYEYESRNDSNCRQSWSRGRGGREFSKFDLDAETHARDSKVCVDRVLPVTNPSPGAIDHVDDEGLSVN